MTNQSISASLGMNKGYRVADSNSKGNFSGQNSNAQAMDQDGDDIEAADAAESAAAKTSKKGDAAAQDKDMPDFDSLLEAYKAKENAKSDNQTSADENGDAEQDLASNAAAQKGEGKPGSANDSLAKLFETIAADSQKAQAKDNQHQPGQQAKEATPQQLLSSALAGGGMVGANDAGKAADQSQQSRQAQAGAASQQNSKPDDAATSGSADAGKASTGKSGLFDAYAVESKIVTALDKIAPVVKEAVMSPSQKALRDGFTVLRQETHFAPTAAIDATNAATTNAVFQQIGTALTNDLGTATAAKADAPSSTPSTHQASTGSFRMANGGEALRVLDIQLHPADLGKVRLSIRLNDTSVDVRVEATNASTAKILEGNKPMLDQLLSKAGYRADHISIVAIDDKAANQITPPNSSNNYQGQSGQQGQSGAFHGQGGNAQNGQGDQQQQHANQSDNFAGMANEATQFASDEGHHDQETARHTRGITL